MSWRRQRGLVLQNSGRYMLRAVLCAHDSERNKQACTSPDPPPPYAPVPFETRSRHTEQVVQYYYLMKCRQPQPRPRCCPSVPPI